MASKRTQIIEALVTLLKENLNGVTYPSNAFDNVYGKQVFWDEVTDYPTICIVQGVEQREYLPSNFKWAFLSINLKLYVEDEDAKYRIEEFFDDIETILDNNNTLTLDGNDLCTDIRILSLSDDEGLLNPIGIGEIELQVRYPV